ncbi:DUF3986 family protein [Bacillus toyonensis]|uniref:DUF3986 family protein n=1 Tax=Bacillus toyonensis TaxID=155322 RepID=UPI003D65A964
MTNIHCKRFISFFCQFSEYPFYDKYGYEIFPIHKKDLDEYEGNKMFTNWLIVNSII